MEFFQKTPDCIFHLTLAILPQQLGASAHPQSPLWASWGGLGHDACSEHAGSPVVPDIPNSGAVVPDISLQPPRWTRTPAVHCCLALPSCGQRPAQSTCRAKIPWKTITVHPCGPEPNTLCNDDFGEKSCVHYCVVTSKERMKNHRKDQLTLPGWWRKQTFFSLNTHRIHKTTYAQRPSLIVAMNN